MSLLSLIGAALGGVLGFYAFSWALKQGFYWIVLPGSLLGAGCSLFSGRRSFLRGGLCGLAAVVLGFFAEWYKRPFTKDESLGYFIQHLNDLQPITFLMIGVSALLAFWLGQGHFFTFGPRSKQSLIPSQDQTTGKV